MYFRKRISSNVLRHRRGAEMNVHRLKEITVRTQFISAVPNIHLTRSKRLSEMELTLFERKHQKIVLACRRSDVTEKMTNRIATIGTVVKWRSNGDSEFNSHMANFYTNSTEIHAERWSYIFWNGPGEHKILSRVESPSYCDVYTCTVSVITIAALTSLLPQGKKNVNSAFNDVYP